MHELHNRQVKFRAEIDFVVIYCRIYHRLYTEVFEHVSFPLLVLVLFRVKASQLCSHYNGSITSKSECQGERHWLHGRKCVMLISLLTRQRQWIIIEPNLLSRRVYEAATQSTPDWLIKQGGNMKILKLLSAFVCLFLSELWSPAAQCLALIFPWRFTHFDPAPVDLFIQQTGIAEHHLFDKEGTCLINIYVFL